MKDQKGKSRQKGAHSSIYSSTTNHMNESDKTREEIILELQDLRKSYSDLKESINRETNSPGSSDGHLKKSDNWLEDIISSMSDWVWEVNENGIYTYCSQTGIDLFGSSSEDIIGKTPFDFMSGDEAERVATLFAEIVRNNSPVKDLENWVIGKNGERICLLTNGVQIHDEKGNLKGYRGVDKVITRQKHAEELLLRSEEKYHMLFNANMDSISILGCDAHGFPSHFIETNDATTSLFGYSKKELLSLNMSNILGKVPEETMRYRIESLKSKGKVDFETTILNKEGEARDIETTQILISYQNQSAIMNISRDITAAKKLLMELVVAKEQAEESDVLKKAFLNNISHEIRTPFNGILGFLSILQYDDLTKNEREEYITIINKSADRLMNTMNDIVEISEIQTGQSKLITIETNINTLTINLSELFAEEANFKGLNFLVINELPPDTKTIFTDQIKLNSVLRNLIGNAIKFTKTGSVEVNIRLIEGGAETEYCINKAYSRDEVCLASTASHLEFSIKDTGVGIPPDKLQTVFKPFMQVDISNTRQYEGTGLGLAISKAYVEMMGGIIRIESQPDKGSVFSFTIPYLTKPGNTTIIKEIFSGKEQDNQMNTAIRGLKILIAEDDETSSLLIETTIKPFCKKAIIVGCGTEAVEVCRENPDIDLVLMDFKMPDLSGDEATRQIRQFNKQVVIIAQTAFALESDRENALKAGCNDYLSKPFKKDQLEGMIKKYFYNAID